MRSRPVGAIVSLRRNLDRNLFKAAPPHALRLGRLELAVAGIALVVLATVVQLFRLGPHITLDSLWAEDGTIYLQGAIARGFFHDLATTYAGYLVFVPRLLGQLGDALPLRYAPATMNLSSAFIASICGLIVWVASAAHIRNPWLRGTLAVVAVLSPVAGTESVVSAAYVPWFMLFPVFWLLIWRPSTTLAAALGGAFILLVQLSSPGGFFFAPLAALRALAIRDRRDALLVGGWVLGFAIQVPVVLHSDETTEALWTHQIWTAFLQRVLDGAAMGERLGGAAWEALGWPLLIMLLLLGAFALIVTLRRASASARWLALICCGTSLIMFVLSVYQRAVGAEMTWPGNAHFGAGGRYAIVPALLLVAAAAILVESAADRWRAHARFLVGGTIAILLIGCAVSFDVRDTSARGTPSWSSALDTAAHECESQALASVPVATSPPGFGVLLSCEEALAASDADPQR